jgi:hypothetical protein
MISVDYDVLNQRGSPAWYSDVFASIPTPGYKGRMFISTDTFAFYRDTGTGWDLIGGPGTGTLTGSGVAGQVSYFNGTQTITGNNNLFWDNVNSRLGINTATPGQPLDIHSTGNTLVQLNNTSTGNSNISFQNQDVAKWRVGNVYNAGANSFDIQNAGLLTNALTISSTTNDITLTGNLNTGVKVINTGGIFCDTAILLKNIGSVTGTNGYSSFSGNAANNGFTFAPNNSSYHRFITPTTSNYDYTLPATTGTIALTSNLSSYLPLAGGIMTGNILLNNNLAISGQLFGTSSYASMISMSPSDKIVIDSNSQGVLFGGTIGQGAYTYTFPSATGTLALTSNLSSYLPLTGGTLTGNLTINPTNTGVVGLDVASNTTRFRSDNLEGFKRQLEITMSSGTVVNITAKGYLANYGTDMAFYTATTGGTNGTPAMYITGTNNRIGIKTGTPAYDLDVAGTFNVSSAGSFASTLLITGVATFNNDINITKGFNASIKTTDNNALFIGANNNNNIIAFANGNTGINTGGSDTGEKFQVTGSARFNNEIISYGGQMTFSPNGGVPSLGVGFRYNGTFYVYPGANGFNVRNNANSVNNLVVYDGGNVEIGGGSRNIWLLEVTKNSSATGAGGYPAVVVNNPDANGYSAFYHFEGSSNKGGMEYSNGTDLLTISTGGNVKITSLGSGAVTATSGVLSTTSDMNLKIEDGYINNALDKVLKLIPRYFYWKKETGLPSDIRQLGFYAQEVNLALGEESANTPKNETDTWGIYDRGMIAMLTKAIQELNEKLVKNNIN